MFHICYEMYATRRKKFSHKMYVFKMNERRKQTNIYVKE